MRANSYFQIRNLSVIKAVFVNRKCFLLIAMATEQTKSRFINLGAKTKRMLTLVGRTNLKHLIIEFKQGLQKEA